MAQFDFRPTPSSFARSLALALCAAALPVSSAWAQSLPQVRIADDTVVRANMRGRGEVLMRPEVGTMLELIDMDGDRYGHRKDNWYLVLLPRDAWGAQRTGWVSGRDVELLPAAARPRLAMNVSHVTAEAPVSDASLLRAPNSAAPANARPAVAGVTAAAAAPASAMSDLVLHFEFGRSELTAAARQALSAPAAELRSSARAFAFSVEGHADWVGNGTFNEKLGLARAESVRQFLSEQYGIPDEKMTIVSYGEGRPAASNATAEGRAENRRVVVKVRP